MGVFVRVIDGHRAELENIERFEADAGAALFEKEGARRLDALDQPHEDGKRRQEDENDGDGYGDVERAFEDSIERTFEGFFPQADEADAGIFKKENGPFEAFRDVFFDVVDDEQADAELFALRADGGCLGDGVGHFQKDNLRGIRLVSEKCEIRGFAENGPRELDVGGGCIGHQADDVDAVLGFALDPREDVPGLGGAAEEQRVLPPSGVEEAGGDEAGKGEIERGERAVQDGDEGEKKDAGNGGVFLGDEKKQEDAEDGERLAK